jgi:hypothetical protein
MAERRRTGKKRPPDRAPKLLEAWRTVIEQFGPETLVIGGKSMGGRMASMAASDLEQAGTPVRGLVCLGYPFHPPGKPEKTRIEHLRRLATPTLILQGTRDTLGAREEVSAYPLEPALRVHWLEDGDHGFKPRKKSGRTEAQNWNDAIETFAAFAEAL